MGGGYYERDESEYDNTNNSNTNNSSTYSSTADKLISRDDIHPDLNPKNYSTSNLISKGRTPIVFAVDVTGSMGDWVKIIYDKFPMFYGQLNLHEYAYDPTVSFCAVGDAECSKVPLQISNFSSGLDIDSNITKLFLEGGGGGNLRESYELPAYFYLEKCNLVNNEFPFLFITGDEAFFNEVTAKNVQKVFGGEKIKQNLNSRDVFKALKDKFNIFHLRKKFEDENKEKGMYKQWADTLGTERVLQVNCPKACIDVILGAIAITTGSRTLTEYIRDMGSRGQTAERIEEVTKALILYDKKLNNGDCYPVKNEKYAESLYKPTNSVLINSSNNNIGVDSNLSFKNRGAYISNIVETYKTTDVYSNEKNKLREKLRKIQSGLDGSIPQEFLCPLTQEILVDPVISSDGTTFERFVISKILTRLGNICPIKGIALESSNVITNVIMKKIIEDFSNNAKI
jgi:hypothetical protein